MAIVVSYENNQIVSVEDGQVAILRCAGKKCRDVIALACNYGVGSITYNGVVTELEMNTAAKILCAGKKMLTDVEIAFTLTRQYFELAPGQISQSAPNYRSTNSARVSYTGIEIVLVPNAKYRLVGKSGVRYGVQQVLAAGVTQIKASQYLSTSYKKDSGWQTTGYEFTANASAAVCWLTASLSGGGSISPTDAMPVYIERIL